MLKIAVIGTGFIGSVHARNVARHPGAELVAVNDANFEFAKKSSGRHRGPGSGRHRGDIR
jgi:predicted dehydrogenase